MGTQAGGWLAQTVGLAWPVAVHLAFDATVVLAVALLVGMSLGRASAATRHRLWTLAVVSLLALPVVRLSVPGAPLLLWESSQPEAVDNSSQTGGEPSAPTGVAATATETDFPEPGPSAADLAGPDAAGDPLATDAAATVPGPFSAVPVATRSTAPSGHPAARPRENAPSRRIAVSSLTVPWRAALAALWGAGAVLMLVMFCISIIRGRRLVQSARQVVEPSWLLLRDEVVAQLGGKCQYMSVIDGSIR